MIETTVLCHVDVSRLRRLGVAPAASTECPTVLVYAAGAAFLN
ncbi:MAG TPA: hypothetical protein VFG00_15315 [Acidothermaceae bacterium]|nr:hypothetical protein [Acidothermaceae bacterium]